MEFFLITPSSNEDFALLTAMFKKMSIEAKVLSEKEKEDLGLALMMREAKNSPRVARESVMRKLSRA
ncbi:hypothetical protein [uncultured Hymenobacter sp.]|uniref:hypothetical protein n=1 Tax=uncultured Hymenobacter sp. TaxID=170016 RepID=UPI0035C9DF1B